MHCPFCRHTDTRVIDSRVGDDGAAIRRRRQCPECDKRFSTVEQMQLTVVKRSGTTEPFDRAKAIAGVAKACKGRPVDADDLARLGQQVEDTLRTSGWAEVPSHEVGLALLGPLRALDEVAYLRFASVYRGFESADDFADEIARLMAERGVATQERSHGRRTPDSTRTPDSAGGAPGRDDTPPVGRNARSTYSGTT
ncbi:MAG: transcriptional repressor NrdR [Propionibacteriales bacterium]|nr:transcriptional repressor NrdR [Propionibacteriales bacterium]